MKAANVQAAVYQRLANYQPLEAIITNGGGDAPGIYDEVPNSVRPPYVVIGDSVLEPFDTDDVVGTDALVELHTWSTYRGRLEVKQMQDAIYDALHRHNLSITDAHTVMVEWEYSETELDPDGITRHGVQRFRVVLED